jgi:hypothetical protein
MYFDITKEKERELDEIGEILEFNQGNGPVIASGVSPDRRYGTIFKEIKGKK